MKTSMVRIRPRAGRAAFKGVIYLPKNMVGKRVILMSPEECSTLFSRVKKYIRTHDAVIKSFKKHMRKLLHTL